MHAEILAAGVFTQKDAADLATLLATGTDAQVQFSVNALRVRFQARLTDLEERKEFVYLLARFVKSFHFLTCFFTYCAGDSSSSPRLPNTSARSSSRQAACPS